MNRPSVRINPSEAVIHEKVYDSENSEKDETEGGTHK
jgi:hypothetical protein